MRSKRHNLVVQGLIHHATVKQYIQLVTHSPLIRTRVPYWIQISLCSGLRSLLRGELGKASQVGAQNILYNGRERASQRRQDVRHFV